jgi:hypothetical protein
MRAWVLACALLAGCDDPPRGGPADLASADLTAVADAGAPEDLAEEGDGGATIENDLGDLGKMPVTVKDVGVICTSCTDGG